MSNQELIAKILDQQYGVDIDVKSQTFTDFCGTLIKLVDARDSSALRKEIYNKFIELCPEAKDVVKFEDFNRFITKTLKSAISIWHISGGHDKT